MSENKMSHLSKFIKSQKSYIRNLKRIHYQVIAATFFGLLFVGALFVFWRQTKTYPEIMIAHEVKKLAEIFEHIDQTAGILNFEHQKNYVDFLNVESFQGSELGSMNLREPKKWQGAYLFDNPTIQGKMYQVVRTKDGYFVVPGPGVVLKDGTVIGQDIKFNHDTDIPALLKDSESLHYKNHDLVAHITLGKKVVPVPDDAAED